MGTISIPDCQGRSVEILTLASPHWEALTPETQQAFHLAAGLEFIERFYLAGGSGLALHLENLWK
jgi:hypothetical protein